MSAISNLLATAALLAATLSGQARAHTWIEEMQVIDSNGSYTGDRGFSRGYMARTDTGFNGESNLWLLPALEARNADQTVRSTIDGSDLLCHPSQRSSNYTNPQYPMLKASPGSYVAMKYLENGHATLPWNNIGKAANGGTVFVYGTTQPQPEEKILDVMKWTEDSSGGDKRGFLIGAMDYDDGECHQINTCHVSAERQVLFPNNIPGQADAQSERWCESDIKIPQNVQTGKLTVYWVWDWSTGAGEDCLAPTGKDQYYTNCADLEIVADGGDAAGGMQRAAAEAGTHTLQQQDPNTRAVRNFASRTAVNVGPMSAAAAYNNKAAATASASQNASWSSFCQTSILAQQASAAANPNALPPSCPPGSYAPTGAEYTAWAASIKAKATDMPTDAPAAATSAPAPTAPPATTPPAATSTSAPAASTSLVTDNGAAATSVVTVTVTQMPVNTLTTYVATSPAPSTPAPAPSAPAAPAPPADDANTAGFPTVSVISNPSASAAAPDAPASGAGGPYNVNAGPGGMGGEHRARRHARQFGAKLN